MHVLIIWEEEIQSCEDIWVGEIVTFIFNPFWIFISGKYYWPYVKANQKLHFAKLAIKSNRTYLHCIKFWESFYMILPYTIKYNCLVLIT